MQKLSFEQQKEVKAIKNKISKIESEITSLERDIESLEVELAKTSQEIDSGSEFFDNYNRKKIHLEEQTQLWYELTEDLQNRTN